MKRFGLIMLLVVLVAGCSAAENDKNNNQETDEQESVMFRHIDIAVEEDVVNIDGDFKSWDGMFYYHILDGEEIIVQEEGFDKQEHKNIWTSFQLELDESDLETATEVPHIVMYGKNEAGEMINPNYVPIDLEVEN